MRLELLAAARREMFRAAAWYDDQSPGLGSRFLDDVRQAMRAIVGFPHAHPPLGNYRRVLLAHFPYSLIFRLEGDAAIIVAVAHTSRRPGYWRRRSGA